MGPLSSIIPKACQGSKDPWTNTTLVTSIFLAPYMMLLLLTPFSSKFKSNLRPKISWHCFSENVTLKRSVKGCPGWLEDWYHPNSVHVCKKLVNLNKKFITYRKKSENLLLPLYFWGNVSLPEDTFRTRLPDGHQPFPFIQICSGHTVLGIYET